MQTFVFVMWLGLYHPWTLVVKWSLDFWLIDVVRIASSLELCPKVRGIDHPVIGSCVLQVMLLQMMLLLIERSSVVVDDRVIERYRRWRSKMKTQCCRIWCSSVEDVPVTVPVADDCVKLPVTYRCMTLMLLKMLSLLAPTVDVVVVNRIPFSLRGVLKYCNF